MKPLILNRRPLPGFLTLMAVVAVAAAVAIVGSQAASVSAQDDSGAAGDRAALMALYNAAGGANWRDNTGWGTTASLDQWHGVTTDANGSVTKLELHENKLNGSIPTELGNLSSLTVLDLSNDVINNNPNRNRLSGAIPTQLGDLSSLTTLDLSGNVLLSGAIPTQLGDLSSLTYLELGGNRLGGAIPAELGKLSNLTHLGLAFNQLSGSIPPELGRLTNLTYLHLGFNVQLSGIIPRELGNLTNLTYFRLTFNNDLQGCMPETLVGLNAGLENLPPCGPNADPLMALYNAAGGAGWSNRSHWGNQVPLGQWHGVTTDEDGNVTELDLSGNRLRGTIPADLGSLSNLTELDLSSNQLSGAIPADLGSLSNLTDLYLEGNQFEGCIPKELTGVANHDLASLNLPACGPVENALMALYEVTGGDDWHRNTDWGTLAPLGDWYGVTADQDGNVTALNLSANRLSGSIPAELGNLSGLTTLNLSHNQQLTGPIPAELGNLSGLTTLNLHNNQLSGSIPADLGRLSNLSTLNLS